MSDCYDGQDLLADVFEGTQHAPDPAPMVDICGSLIMLWANPADPRWSVDMSRRPNGDVTVVRSIRRARSDPDGPESPKITELTPSPPHGDQEAVLGALRGTPEPRNRQPSPDAPPTPRSTR
jgi:hypothetical protein